MTDQKNKKCLIITEVFAPEEFLINDLAFKLKNQGFLISVLTKNPSYPKGKIFSGYKNRLYFSEIINGIKVSRVQFIPGYKKRKFIKILNYLWNMFLGLLWALKNGKKFDSIFIYQTGPLTFSAIGVFISKIYKKETTIWTQDVWPDTVYAYGLAKRGLSRILLEKFVKWIYSNCDNIAVSCPGYKEIINKYCLSKNIHFIPQWSLTPKLTENHDQTTSISYPGQFNFVFAGNIGKVQNLENVIMGFELFIRNSSKNEVWLNLIGDGSHLEYLQLLVKDNCINNIRFWGRKSVSEMPYFYNNADVLIVSLEDKPIFNLTIPAKFQSYLNAEKPLYGIISGEVANLIQENNLGWVAKPGDINQIAEIFETIVTCNSEEFAVKKINSVTLLEDQFNRDKNIEKLTSIAFN